MSAISLGDTAVVGKLLCNDIELTTGALNSITFKNDITILSQDEECAVHIGTIVTNQGRRSVAVGDDAGTTSQGQNAVAIGHRAGQGSQTQNAVAIGNNAGEVGQN